MLVHQIKNLPTKKVGKNKKRKQKMDIHDGQHIDVAEAIVAKASNWATQLLAELN